jgi:NAD(P)H-flavin reductase
MTAVCEKHKPDAANPWAVPMARIRKIRKEVPRVVTYDLVFEDPKVAGQYRFAPGQFNMLYLPGFGEAAISISSDPAEHGVLSHTVREAGNVTQALARYKEGDQIGIRGPFGTAWPMDLCRGRDVVLACGGIGLAPLRPAIYHILRHRADFGRVILLYGARTAADLLYPDQYDDWKKNGIEVEVTVDVGGAGWKGHVGVVPVLFYRLRLDAARTTLMTCGPEIMMRFVVFEALARRIANTQIFISMERNMKCGMGFCGHCQLGPTFVCKDGPVFDYVTMEPFMHVEDF